ncbi:hypothetical protein BpHYR1_042670 [Brachionus plicatilis]|uniref:EF-hand domain-containing protein n=1 Tax=Brachionus plicatilis TaxID=10195 RepID=A0A3M7R3I1_BRAPC|nr:hypothetical protein BpHYR1_042670 [Brachionus plicatilis]
MVRLLKNSSLPYFLLNLPHEWVLIEILRENGIIKLNIKGKKTSSYKKEKNSTNFEYGIKKNLNDYITSKKKEQHNDPKKMSYYKFRNISGMDHSIDKNEYSAYYQNSHPYSNPYSNYRNSHDEFSLVDRNRNGRIDYHEFRDAENRKNGYYPGQYSSNFYGGYKASYFFIFFKLYSQIHLCFKSISFIFQFFWF